MDIKLIRIIAPPTPGCFHDRLSWAEYLHSAQAHKCGVPQPFKDGQYQTDFNFCMDCNAQHSAEMVRQQKCDFKGYVAKLNGVSHLNDEARKAATERASDQQTN